MSELTEKLRQEAQGLRKQASYQDAYTHSVLRELHDGLGLDKSASASLNTYDLMEKVKQVLEAQSLSPQIGIELNRIRTPEQLVEYLDNANFQLRKTAADQSDDSEDDDEEDDEGEEEDEKDKSGKSFENKDSKETEKKAQELSEEEYLTRIKVAAVSELVQKGVNYDDAIEMIEASFQDEGDE